MNQTGGVRDLPKSRLEMQRLEHLLVVVTQVKTDVELEARESREICNFQ